MEWKSTSLVLVLFSLTAIASQTNWVTSVSWYRDVDGKLYNTEKSVKFQNFSGDVVEVMSNAIILQTKRTVFVPDPQQPQPDSLTKNGNFLGGSATPRPISGSYKTVYGEKIFITNFPDEMEPTTGSHQQGRGMITGRIKVGADVLQLWDYGTPHHVAVISTNVPPKSN